MFKSSFQLARVFGIPIRLDLSLLFLMGWIWLDALQSGSSILTAFFIGGVYAALLLFSIVLHELGHSLVSMRFGCRVRAITLMLIGGRAELSHIPTKPIHELAVAIAGPLVSLTLWLGSDLGMTFLSARQTGFLNELLIGVLWMLSRMNCCLFWFNLIPAFPMDGGRVLRAFLAHGLGRLRATQIASTCGRAIAILALLRVLLPGAIHLHMARQILQLGAYALPIGPFDISFDKIMLALIALFIFQAAGQEYRMVQIEEYYRSQGQQAPWMPPPSPKDSIVVSPPPYDRDDSSSSRSSKSRR